MFNRLPLAVLSDTYKASHFKLYPDANKMVAYAEFRQPYDKDAKDHRIVFYGMRYLIENYIAVKWTEEMVEQADKFYATHCTGFSPYPYPKHLFLKFIRENDGYFPCVIEALSEGSVCYPHVPVYQITTEKEYAPLCTWLETLLTMVWYPSTVATLSRRAHELIRKSFEASVDEDAYFLLNSRLHDFGFRGCTSVEQSIIGGCAHLLNFEGTDTMSAAYYAQFHLNNGEPVATSIPATEHSIMTAWSSEREAMLKMIEEFGTGVFACVMDSYDYAFALDKVVPSIARRKLEKGGFLVLRPDSGDPIETVLMGLRAADKVFGSDKNKKGFKVLRGCGVIQGDGVSYETIQKILESAMKEGFSAQNIAFGMGGGLLQKVNRDTMSFATKLCHLDFIATGEKRDIMKMPKTDTGKISLPGELAVYLDKTPIVYPKEAKVRLPKLMNVIYDYGKVPEWESFSQVRKRVDDMWRSSPTHVDVLSDELKQKIEHVKKDIRSRTDKMFNELVGVSD